jgi:SanA protein
MSRFKKLALITFALITIVIFAIISINSSIKNKSKSFIFNDISKLPKCYTAIVLGAKVFPDGRPSNYLQDRLDKAIELYKRKKVSRFLLSGDHGQTNYDEVNNMKAYLIKNGIDTKDIFLDHAGFDTYNTMVRAKEIFEVKDAIIVSQDFHLPRAIYIAREKGIKAYEITADNQEYANLKSLYRREKIANIKAFLEILINKKPKFLGEKIPITGDSKLSYD